MKKILSCAAVAAMIVLAWSADGAVTAQTTAPAKKTAAKKKTSTAKKSGTMSSSSEKRASTASARKPGTATSASARGKKAPAKRVTWRSRQMSPSPDRYREIQGALAAKGFLKPEDATGNWNQSSSDALKKFQEEQNLESSGKIDSLSLIALGLGPRHDSASPPPPKSPPLGPGQ